jgi:hypothetical protein
MERAENQQAEHRNPSNSSESISRYIVWYSRGITGGYCIAAIVHCMAQ